jgi:4-hydroxybenzoate polyprenyltransferase
MFQKLNLFIELTRLKKPIGYMLLFWPCLWGLTIAYDFTGELLNFYKYLIFFLAGAILMRSAGCIINDISDKNFDKKVERTKFRPIASGKISIKLALFYASTLCLLALLILINFNFFTIVLAICSIPLAFTYPLIKRFTYWPQLYLGITFNYGIILGWTSINPEIDIKPLVFYFGAIFWTLGYDTIYGFQDIKDDEIIGVKSTSILFKNNPKMFLNIVFFLFVVFYLTMGFLMKFNLAFFILSIIPISHLFLYQIKKFDPLNPDICLSTFKSNNLFGLIIFANLLIGKITF